MQPQAKAGKWILSLLSDRRRAQKEGSKASIPTVQSNLIEVTLAVVEATTREKTTLRIPVRPTLLRGRKILRMMGMQSLRSMVRLRVPRMLRLSCGVLVSWCPGILVF